MWARQCHAQCCKNKVQWDMQRMITSGFLKEEGLVFWDTADTLLTSQCHLPCPVPRRWAGSGLWCLAGGKERLCLFPCPLLVHSSLDFSKQRSGCILPCSKYSWLPVTLWVAARSHHGAPPCWCYGVCSCWLLIFYTSQTFPGP